MHLINDELEGFVLNLTIKHVTTWAPNKTLFLPVHLSWKPSTTLGSLLPQRSVGGDGLQSGGTNWCFSKLMSSSARRCVKAGTAKTDAFYK